MDLCCPDRSLLLLLLLLLLSVYSMACRLLPRAGLVAAQVKEYLERQWHKILANRVSVQDFVFAKEVRLGTYSPKAAVVPPAAIVAAKAMATDPRAEPRFAERVPYVVVYGERGKLLFCALACLSVISDTCQYSQAMTWHAVTLGWTYCRPLHVYSTRKPIG